MLLSNTYQSYHYTRTGTGARTCEYEVHVFHVCVLHACGYVVLMDGRLLLEYIPVLLQIVREYKLIRTNSRTWWVCTRAPEY